MLLKKTMFAFAAGLLFAFGLVVSGMTQPAKVAGFLHVSGLAQGISWRGAQGFWDPSLGLVMFGALMVTFIGFSVTPQLSNPWADDKFYLPNRNDIDSRLVFGAASFGVGWGLAGYCPGPGIASLLTGGVDAVAFVAAMAVGMWVAKRWFV